MGRPRRGRKLFVSTLEPAEPRRTASTVDLPAPQPEPVVSPTSEQIAEPQLGEDGQDIGHTAAIQTAPTEVTFVPMAVTVGDGFKFGCGFFMAFVLAMLVGFVLLAALFALNSLIGLNLPPFGR